MRIFCYFCLLLVVINSQAYEAECSTAQGKGLSNYAKPWSEFQIAKQKYVFSGFASYYNDVNFYIVGKDIFLPLEPGNTYTLEDSAWLALVARFEVMLVQGPGLSFSVNDRLECTLKQLQAQFEEDHIRSVKKSALHTVAPHLDQLRYAQLWAPLSWLAKLVEHTLVIIHGMVQHWGLAIVVFSILLKLALLPVHRMVTRMQYQVGALRSVLELQLDEIRAKYRGEEAHNRIMASYRALGITPFYSMKPLLGVLVQVPIWIAVFNALGEMPQLAGQSFLWIDDLAYPDVIAVTPFNIPLFGTTVHLLPFLMSGLTCLSTLIIRNSQWTKKELVRQRRNLFWMALAFLLLLYPFPAAMVLYWTLNILLQFVIQLFDETSVIKKKAINAD